MPKGGIGGTGRKIGNKLVSSLERNRESGLTAFTGTTSTFSMKRKE
jgi:hypothetical protein